ncbi:MAG: HPr(Ser) kinase/phosphatase [Erysipelotrichaceae bacterium]|nr:HPr(Ser) kinase/phosphatase [Erysipelotrichaceae bacterium]
MGKNEELSKRVYVSELKEYFHLKQITGDAESLKRWIIAPDVNRPGLELAGYIDTTDLKRVVIIGNKECGLLNTMDYATQKARFEFITDSYTPCIIMSNGNKTPAALEEIAKARNFPVFETDWQTYMAVQNVVAYLSRKLAPDTSMHGVMLNIYGKGVLLTGKSGIGKSELALELIRRGHFFVSDDRVEISRVQNDLFCSAPDILKGMLEIRGVGIIDVNMMFGASTLLESCNLDLIIHLEEYGETHENNRLNYSHGKIEILGLQRPVIDIPITPGRQLSVIIETAVSNFRLMEKGINSTEDFKQRVLKVITEKNKGVGV